MFRLRGKGVKSVRSGAIGDLVCKAVIETPCEPIGETESHVEGTGRLDGGWR